MNEGFEKSKHYNILNAEGKKNNKKKRVSFSLFQAETFDEIEKLRKMRETQLNNFLESKLKTNQPILLNIKNRSKQASPNRTMGNTILKNSNQKNKINNKNEGKENNKFNTIPKPQKKINIETPNRDNENINDNNLKSPFQNLKKEEEKKEEEFEKNDEEVQKEKEEEEKKEEEEEEKKEEEKQVPKKDNKKK